MAWQSMFLLVPVVSTTFASFSRMFGRFGADSLGWLLIDEAGQATPQAAVGGIWRARRTVVVGDPLQLEPISSLPWTAERSLGKHFKVGEEWSPGRVSVQQLADRVARYGTRLSQTTADAQPVWVGSPLRVHRRSDRPIFEICNAMAYDDLMVYGTSPRGMFPGRDRWIDVEGPAEKGNWVPAETEQLGKLLQRLVDEGIAVDQIRVLSPFRNVINEAKRVHRSVFSTRHTEAAAAAERWVGTVHTMQGKEADVIILVLGGDPGRPGVRAWAAERPNLLNVAVSRARRRLYVIGNRRLWDRERYSRVLVSHLQAWRPSEPVHSLP
jgi:superfamily I DNA and/or RNA helicase